MNWQNFEKDLNELSHRGVRKSVEAMQRALAECAHPELAYPIVHIAGTNGKGSSSSFLAQILAQNGYKVGLALSPHAEHFCERIQIFDSDRYFPKSLISENDLLALHGDFKTRDDHFLGLTYFEYALLLGLEYFRRERVDIAVLETGLGGRWDATNACPSIVSGIVTVGLDHMRELGDTVEKILWEKIQIVKPESDFVFGPKDAKLVEMAQDFCKANRAEFHKVVRDPVFWQSQNLQHLPTIFQNNIDFVVALASCLKQRGFRFDSGRGYALSLPPARYETLSASPLIFLDGAHNEPALRALKAFLTKHWGEDYDLVFGCLSDRDALGLAQMVIPQNGLKFWLKFPAHGRETEASTYEALQQRFGGFIFDFTEEFSRKLRAVALKRPLVVCGSFYLCSAFRAFFREFLL